MTPPVRDITTVNLSSDMKRETDYTMVYGLSADPVHQAHVDLVVATTKELSNRKVPIAEIVIIPVYRRNPVGTKRKGQLMASFEERLTMCRLAAREIRRDLGELGPQVEASRIEQELAGDKEDPNYTVETLQALQSEAAPGGNWVLLLGSDLVSGDDPELRHWHQVEKLVQLATIAIYPRPGYPNNLNFLKELAGKGAKFVQLDEVARREESASQIRKRLKEGHDPLILYQERLLPKPVALFIKERGLYSGRG